MSGTETNGAVFQCIVRTASEGSDEVEVAKELITTFRHMEGRFYKLYHPSVEVGLNIHEALKAISDGNPASVFTKHGSDHIRQLIQVIDQVATGAGLNKGDQSLSAREAYILLSAAHLHDIGNAFGRTDHEKFAYEMVKKHPDLFSTDSFLKQAICTVAEAHGGEHAEFKKDTIRPIEARADFRLPLLAVILRLSDELSEGEDRVLPLVEPENRETESPLAIAYARAFKPFELRGTHLFVEYWTWPELEAVQGKVKDGDLDFVAYLERRLIKLEKETRYCSQYARPDFDIRQITVSILQYNQEPPAPNPKKHTFTINLTHGYPEECKPYGERKACQDGPTSLKEMLKR